MARAHKIVLVGMDSVPEGEHFVSVPFRPDDLDGMWRTVCSCGEVFGPVADDGEVFREELTGKSWPKVQGDLFDAARRHAYVATTGRTSPGEVEEPEAPYCEGCGAQAPDASYAPGLCADCAAEEPIRGMG